MLVITIMWYYMAWCELKDTVEQAEGRYGHDTYRTKPVKVKRNATLEARVNSPSTAEPFPRSWRRLCIIKRFFHQAQRCRRPRGWHR